MRKRRVTPIGALSSRSFCWCSCLWCAARCTIPRTSCCRRMRAVAMWSDASLDDSAVGRIAVRPDTVPVRPSRRLNVPRATRAPSRSSATIPAASASTAAVSASTERGCASTPSRRAARRATRSPTGKERGSGTAAASSITRSAAAFTADEEQGIPTYEDILRLDKKRIAAADYRLLDTVDCIFVETAADDGGYIERYWVSVSDGLLCAAEKLQGEDVVYRMAGMSVDSGNVAEDAFTLPDGTVLHESALDGANR